MENTMETTQNAQSQEVDVSSVYVPDHCREVSPEGQVLWELDSSLAIYRATRLDSLY